MPDHAAFGIDEGVSTESDRDVRILQAISQCMVEARMNEVILVEKMSPFSAGPLKTRIPVSGEAKILWLSR